MTYTFATLEVSQAVYDEVRAKLLEAGYEHAITSDSSEEELIDMHGIALAPAPDLGLLADLTALKVSGPAIVFFRPRMKMPLAELEQLRDAASLMSRREPNLSFVMMPVGIDIMAVGEVDLERYGLRRIT